MINFNIELNQQYFMANSKPQAIYGLIRIKPEEIKGRIPMDIKFLIDISGSMGDIVVNKTINKNLIDTILSQFTNKKSLTKLQLVKIALKEVIGRMEVNDRISIITFASDAKEVASMTIKNDGDKQLLKDKVDKIRTDGCTNMSKALDMAINMAEDNKNVKRIIIFTDGEVNWPSVDEEERLCIDLAHKAKKSKIPFTAFGTGISYNDNFLNELAAITSGRMEHISDPVKVIEVFNQEIGILGDVAITNLEAVFETKPDIKLREVSRVIPQIEPVKLNSLNYLFLSLGDLDRTRGQAILFQAEIPPVSEGTHEIGTLGLTFDVPLYNLRGQKAEIKIYGDFTLNSSLCRINDEVISTIQMAGATKLQTLALERADAGDVTNATKMMEQVYTLYTKLGQDDLATQVKTLTNAIKTKGNISGDSTDVRRTLTTKSKQTISRTLMTKKH